MSVNYKKKKVACNTECPLPAPSTLAMDKKRKKTKKVLVISYPVCGYYNEICLQILNIMFSFKVLDKTILHANVI